MRTSLGAVALVATALPVAAAPSPGEDGFRSTTAAYSPYREAAIVDWRTANDNMGPMSGHAGHAGGHVSPVPGPERGGMHGERNAPQETGGHHPHMGGKP